MQHQPAAADATLHPTRYRLRAFAVIGAAALVLLAHSVDVAHAHGPNWPALALRAAWSLLLVGHGLVVLRSGSVRWVRAFGVVTLLGSAVLFLALLAVTGRSASPLFPFSHVLALILPLILPESLPVAMVAAVLVLGGTSVMLVRDGAAGDPLLAWGHAGVVALLVGWLFGVVHRRTNLALDAAARSRQEALEANQRLVAELREALARVKTLRGLLPVCAWCHRARDDRGYWDELEAYVAAHSEAEISHAMCPDCFQAHFPDAGRGT